jgi:hypothetical protein
MDLGTLAYIPFVQILLLKKDLLLRTQQIELKSQTKSHESVKAIFDPSYVSHELSPPGNKTGSSDQTEHASISKLQKEYSLYPRRNQICSTSVQVK